MEIADIESLMPQDHLLRMIDKTIGFSFIYDLVRDRYSMDKGRQSADPVVLVKLTRHLYGIRKQCILKSFCAGDCRSDLY